MRELATSSDRGKVKRVFGIFLLMIGAGVILDSSALWVGATLMSVGLAMLGWGLVEARPIVVPSASCSMPESAPTASCPTEHRP
jgi:hypothetical protein